MRICQLLLHACQKEDHAFIIELFQQLTHWDPDKDTLEWYVGNMREGWSKNDLIIHVLNLPDAIALYQQAPDPSHLMHTVAHRLQNLMSMNDEDFVRHLFWELLYREAEPHGLAINVDALRQGVPRITFISQMLESREWSILLYQRHLYAGRILEHFLSSL